MRVVPLLLWALAVSSHAQAPGGTGAGAPAPDVVPTTTSVPAPATAPATVLVPVAAEPTPEEREFALLLADLQRYNALSPDEVRRELVSQNQSLARTRSDSVRVRVAVLITLTRSGQLQDDQRALALFEQVAKGNSGPVALRQLAAVLAAQVAERIRAVRDEQAKSEAALQKLEALRSMERSLLRDRVRSGGGGGGAGSGGGN